MANPRQGPPQPETRAIRRLQTASAEAELALARRMAMNPNDLTAMSHLSFADHPIGPGELSDRLGMSPAATTELVDRLERAGHVVRQRDLADRRRVRLEPSATATAEVLDRLGSLFTALDGLLDDYSPAERTVLQRYLDDVAGAFERFSRDE
jgi:DNA-binding MarR family transcriptional regulator